MIFKKSRRGFTLVELAIVLGIIGLLLAGLFQLTYASSRQINNQITAQQLQAWSKAAKSYLITKRVNGTGTEFYGCTPTCGNTTYQIALNTVQNITADVYGFKANGLPSISPLGASYKVVVKRIDDVGGQGSYVIVVGFGTGTANYDSLQLGNIATFTGAEGARISVPNSDPASTTTCGGSMAAIGAFGGVCYDVSAFGFTANRPGTLAFFNMIDSGNSDSNYLWRVPAIPGDYNKMTVDLSMGLGGKSSVTGNPDILFNGNGSIAMDGGAITGVRGGIQTNNGSIDTGGGTISTATGDIATGGGTISTATGDITTGGGGIVTVGGTITTGSGDIVAPNGNGSFNTLNAQAFIYTSDRRLKTNIQTLDNALEKITRLRGVSFDWLKTGQRDIGVIAQEVEEVYPELVSIKQVDGKEQKGVQIGNLVGPMIEAIKELKAQNEALKLRVDTLESKRTCND